MKKIVHFLLLSGLLALASTVQAGDTDTMPNDLKPRINRAATVPDTLQNPDFEVIEAGSKVPGWSGVVHAGDHFRVESDEAQMFSGKRSLLIKNIGKPSWGGVIQTIRVERLAGQEIELSTRMKSQGVTAPGFNMTIKILQMGRELGLVSTNGEIMGDADWMVVSLRTRLPMETTHLEVHLILDGGGQVWVDDVHIDSLAENSKRQLDM